MEHVKENLGQAQTRQKRWYDKRARTTTFKPGDKVLLLLPIATNKLMAQWQGPYSVIRQVSPVTYEIDVSNKRKKRKIVHMNMLKRWNEPVETCYWTEDVSDDGDDDEVPTWCNDPSNGEAPAVGEQLKLS